MKESPQDKSLDQILRSSRLVAGGFMGEDQREVFDVINADVGELARLGLEKEQLAARMHEITNLAVAGLGTWVRVGQHLEAQVDEARGALVCPWPHSGCFAKRITSLRSSKTGETLCRWSDLNIHLIGEHGFFEGRGSHFRIEPRRLAETIL
ncbi:MAG: hypothetical protein P8Z79_18600 [Sedimentisphaerales bacterium]|jgi:hypothetical protein